MWEGLGKMKGAGRGGVKDMKQDGLLKLISCTMCYDAGLGL